MSLFGKLGNTKRAIKEQSPADSLPESPQYRHVPTHAAIDALACAPPGWRHMEDRKAIQAQHNHRSEMSKSASGCSVLTTLDQGSSHNANAVNWTESTTDQSNACLAMPVLPDFETTRRRSPLHASELPVVPSYERIATSELSNSISSRSSSMPEIPPRNPQRVRNGESRMGHMTPGIERGLYGADSGTGGMALYPQGTRPWLSRREPTPRRPEPVPPVAMSRHQVVEPSLRPIGLTGEASEFKHYAGDERRCLSKNSVYNDIGSTAKRKKVRAPGQPATQS